MISLVIRKADNRDAPSVLYVFNIARGEMVYLPQLHTHGETKAFILSLIESGEVWIAEYDHEIVGFLEVHDGWLNHLYILPLFQNKGIGKQLLDTAKKISPSGLSLWVFEKNTGAINFYERERFVLQEKRSDDQATNEEHLADRRYHWTK